MYIYYCILQIANFLHEELFSIPREFLENDASVAVQIAWDMLMLNPPAIACKPEKYTESWHKEYGPRWNKKKSMEELYYFSPMLLLGAGGTVASKALVGNKKRKIAVEVPLQTNSWERPEKHQKILRVRYVMWFIYYSECKHRRHVDGVCGAELSIMALHCYLHCILIH